ncbi:RING finger domain protein [Mycena indigotica]|uniref:RING finger domain protein n=1 Tax=Mycena indigotica TaxID=2126181 RepID=A0A8H6T0K3_9AGAR|nr:RING finger domain protein [Mycena indigotica]KAF7309478.1 RING finger domain protein [Mycena indigotica]
MNRPVVATRSARITPSAVTSTRTPISNEGQWTRSKSRSPSRHGAGTRLDPFNVDASSNTGQPSVKRKRSLNSVGNSNSPVIMDDVDRGQRIKSKPLLHRTMPPSASSSRPRKDRETSARPRSHLDSSHHTQQLPTVNPTIRQVDTNTTKERQDVATAIEFERMRKELETLKKESKKQAKKQNKTIEDLKAQLAAEKLSREQQERALTVVSTKLSKNEQLVQTIESSLQCQICIELLSRPHLLVPCGHIFCSGCLEQWFRAAPAGEDEDDDMGDDFLLHREKKCPTCRARVVRRPVPTFIVKDVVNTLRPTPPSAGTENDPWKGLFLEDYDSDGSNDDEDMEDYDGYSDGGSEDAHAAVFGHWPRDELAALMFGANPLAGYYGSNSGSDDGMGHGSEDDESGSGSENEDDDEVYSDAEEELFAAPVDRTIWPQHNVQDALHIGAINNNPWYPPLAFQEEELEEIQPRRRRRNGWN